MLTRAKVGRMLGKSIATVRRMEGTNLHPVRDCDGVWLFDEDEVRQVAQEAGGARRAPGQLPHGGQDCDWFADLRRKRKDDQQERDATEAGHRNQAVEQDIRERVAALERLALEQRERAALQTGEAERRRKLEQQQLMAMACELLEALNGLRPRQLVKLGGDVWRYLDELMRRLKNDE